MYDLIIVGAGPAGFTAAIYALRAGKKVLMLEKGTIGGQITYSPKVENYPGFISISGMELGDKLYEQALNLGVELEIEEVTGIKDYGSYKTVTTDRGEYQAQAVIIAAGSRHRLLGLTGETDFIGRGISFCALCDGAFYKGRSVAVIGGGNTALQDAVLLADICKEVTIIQNLEKCTGEGRLIENLKKRGNVSFLFNTVVEKLIGDDDLTALELLNTAEKRSSHLPVDGIFVAIGQVPENGPFANICRLDEQGYIQAVSEVETGTPGIFAAGDCRVKTVRQIVTAMSDGASAAMQACKYLEQ